MINRFQKHTQGVHIQQLLSFNRHQVAALGRIHLVLNKTLTDNTSVKWAQLKTFLCLIQFC